MDVAAFFVRHRAETRVERKEGTDPVGIDWGGPVMQGRESVEAALRRSRRRAGEEPSGAIPPMLLAALERRPELRRAVLAAMEEDEQGTS